MGRSDEREKSVSLGATNARAACQGRTFQGYRDATAEFRLPPIREACHHRLPPDRGALPRRSPLLRRNPEVRLKSQCGQDSAAPAAIQKQPSVPRINNTEHDEKANHYQHQTPATTATGLTPRSVPCAPRPHPVLALRLVPVGPIRDKFSSFSCRSCGRLIGWQLICAQSPTSPARTPRSVWRSR